MSVTAEVLSTHTPALFALAVEKAAMRLRAGEVVALPTETVYGLAANALDPVAVAKIFKIKGRPSHNPIIVHVASRAQAMSCSSSWPMLADRLGAAFWPGPLTLVVPRSTQIPDLLAAGGPTVGIRWPQHPFIQAVIKACGFPLAAPSANRSNQLSPTSASHVVRALGKHISLIIDGGDANVGLESTVVDVTGTHPRILRPGMIDAAAVAAAARIPLESAKTELEASSVAKSPGLMAKHYSPRAQLIVTTWIDERDLMRQLQDLGADPTKVWVLSHTHIPLGANIPNVAVIPEDPEAYARALYGELHRFDEAGAEFIMVERPPEGVEWEAIADRLQRASAQ